MSRMRIEAAKAILAARIIAELDEAPAHGERPRAWVFSREYATRISRFTLDRLMKMLAALDGRGYGRKPDKRPYQAPPKPTRDC